MLLKKYYKSFLSLILIFILCFLPGNTANKVTFFDIPHFDKLVHFGMYFIFSGILFFDLKKNSHLQKKQIISIIILLTIITGGSVELIQNYFIPGRSGDWFDLFADITGMLGFFTGKYFLYLLRKNNLN